MSNATEALEREWAFFSHVIDPLVREVLATDDAWEAYRRANAVAGPMLDTSPGTVALPHLGGVYVAWQELTDVYETGKTPDADAHEALRSAARSWLDRPLEPSAEFIEQWIADARNAAGALFKRDGDWWNDPA